MSWNKVNNATLTPGVDLDLRNATINPIKVYINENNKTLFPLYFSEYLTIDENNAIGCTSDEGNYAVTYDSNGNLLDFYYSFNAS